VNLSSEEKSVTLQAATSSDPISKQEMIERAKSLASAFRQRAAEAEQDRRISAKSAAELVDAGFARMLVPRRLGGSELGIDTWFEATLEIGRGDASHAWVAGLMAHVPQMLGQFGEQAQQAIWGEEADVPTAGSVMPFAQVTAVEGGYRITTKAPFASGVTHSTWVFVGGFLPEEKAPTNAMFLIPPSQYEIEDTWFTSGMRGTGSNTIVTNNVFVPTTHVLRVSDLREATGPGRALSAGGIYRLPFMSYAPLGFVAPMLGTALNAYDIFVEWAKKKKLPGGQRLVETAGLQTALGRIAGDLAAAELLLRWVVDTAEDEGAVTLEHRRACMRNYTRAAELAAEAIDQVVKLGGTFSFAEINPIQRAWRDIHFAASHVSLQGEINYAQYARGDLDVPTPPTVEIY
jgi:3-hydroxy-9,10-secoandrosta-1,3,5(10)-triene-9,17-dione monooxygenase